tara:strand:+ start:425 stop:814 length:390 start_codon:yes stop_codon:yes gene_type:complete
MKLLFTILCSFLTGCCSTPRISNTSGTASGIVDAVTPLAPNEPLTMLSAIGGLCLLAGMVLLVISRGTMGWRPIIGGVILVVLNYAIAEFATWIFLPVLLGTGAISLAWAWKTVRDILKIRKEKSHGIS